MKTPSPTRGRAKPTPGVRRVCTDPSRAPAFPFRTRGARLRKNRPTSRGCSPQGGSYSSSHGRDSRPSLQSFFGNGAPSHGKGTRSDRRRHVAPRGFSSPPGLPRAWDRTPPPGPGTPLLPARVPPHWRHAPRAVNGAVPWVWRARLRPGFLQATCRRRGRTQGEQRGADRPSPRRGPGPPAAGCRAGGVGKRPRRLYLPSLPVPQLCHSQAAWDHTAF